MRTDLILDPERLADVPVFTLLEAAGSGFLAPDHRFLHAILDRGQAAVPDLVRFAAEERPEDIVDLEPQLIDLFRHLRTPESIPFLINVIRKSPEDIPDDLIENFAALGSAAIAPLLALLEEVGENSGDIPFTLAILGIHDPRILDMLVKRLDVDLVDTVICLEVYGDPAAIPALEKVVDKDKRVQILIDTLTENSKSPVEAVEPEPFDIYDLYPARDSPDLDELEDDEILAMLNSSVPERQIDIARYFANSELPLPVRARLLDLAKNSPHMNVRGASWEALQEVTDEPEVRRAMLRVLEDTEASPEEKGGVAIALASQSDNPAVFNAIEELYRDPRSRAAGLKAMGRSLDRRFSDYPPRHLDDPDPELRRQAIWGVGFLNLSGEAPRLEPFFEDRDFRADALFAYALSVPGETSRPLIRLLLAKIESLAGGLRGDEEELVEMALDQRLVLHGKKAVFFTEHADEDQPEPVVSPAGKVGRNDPCPCGSGKKYKKCCGV